MLARSPRPACGRAGRRSARTGPTPRTGGRARGTGRGGRQRGRLVREHGPGRQPVQERRVPLPRGVRAIPRTGRAAGRDRRAAPAGRVRRLGAARARVRPRDPLRRRHSVRAAGSSTSPRCGCRSPRRSSPGSRPPREPRPSTRSRGARARGFAVAPNDAGVEQLAPLNENFLVWLDGPAPARARAARARRCSTPRRSETNLNNLGGKLALIFRDGRDFCGADVVRHEIGHNLGALQPDAPNTTDGVHCNDAFEDTMCDWRGAAVARRPVHGQSTSTTATTTTGIRPRARRSAGGRVNLSRFLCPDAQLQPARPASRAAAPRSCAARRAAASSGAAGDAHAPASSRRAPAAWKAARHSRGAPEAAHRIEAHGLARAGSAGASNPRRGPG